jgi:acyl-CoA synthetase (NDP forming)/RimJ/RimL family protein N-acetyltransferase
MATDAGAPAPSAFPADGADVALRDGGVVHIREVRDDDHERLAELLNALDPEDLRLRYFTAGVNVDRMARYAAQVHERDGAGLVAEGDGALLGHAEFIRVDADSAEVAFETAPAAQGRGLATVLLAHLAQMATRWNITTFTASVLPENHHMIDVFRASGFSVKVTTHPGELIVEFPCEMTAEARSRFEERERRAAVEAVRGLLQPASVAVIGASNRAGSVGSVVWGNLASGFTGELHPVNRRRRRLDGHPVVKSVKDLDPAPELAVVVVPADAVLDVVDECAEAGVARLLIVSAGFAEGDARGAARQEELMRRCRAAGIRVVGPNALGLINTDPEILLNASVSGQPPVPGAIGVLSQSAGMGLALMERARRAGLGLSTFVSVGNKADISGNDLLQYWEDDPRTEVALLYLQSFGNPRKFARIARRMGRSKPILAVKGGRTPPRVDADASSTGALLAGSDITVDTLCRQVGVIRGGSLDEVLDVARIFTSTALPKGRRVAILTTSRGPALLCADACADSGLLLPPLEPGTRERLLQRVPEGAPLENPVDLFATAGPKEIRHAVSVLADADEVDALIVIVSPSLAATAKDAARAIAAGAADAAGDTPILAAFPADEAPPADLDAGPARIASFTLPEAAARALGRAATYAQWRDRPVEPPATVQASTDAAAAVIARALADGGGWLTPADADRVCTAYGLPVARGEVVDSPEEAVQAAERVGLPVALKAVAGQPPDRGDLTSIALDLDSDAGIMAAGARLLARAKADGEQDARLLVQEMVPPGVRILVGVVGDPQFGPMVVCGAGGIEAELIRDVAVRLTPVSRGDVRAMVRELRTFPRLTGYRGAPEADVDALEDVLVRVGAMAEAHPEIAEMDCNPVMVSASGAAITDVRIRVAPATPVAPLPSVGGA